MQFLRNITWWFIGLTTVVVFALVLLLSELLAGQFWELPQTSLITVYVCLILGYINRFKLLRLGETLVHEMGHAQMAALTFGKVQFIRVERDTSGVTWYRPRFFLGRITSALVSLFGPISSAVIFLITARLVSSELTAYWAIGAGLFVSLILITTVRNLWGWITGLVLMGVIYLVLESSGYIEPQFLGPENLNDTNILLVNVILGVTAFNLGSALEYSVKCRRPRSPNMDEYQFSRALFIPPVVGGHLIIVVQLLLLWISLSFLLGWPSMFEVGKFI